MDTHLKIVTVAFFVAACGGSSPPPEVGQIQLSDNRDSLAIIREAEDKRVFDSRLEDFASWTVANVRRATAVALGRIGDPSSARVLAKLAEDPDLTVRDAAVFSIGLLGDSASDDLIDLLVKKLGTESRKEGLIAVINALGRVGRQEQVQDISELALNKTKEVRVAAIRALGIMGMRHIQIPQTAVLGLKKNLEDPDELVRFMTTFFYHRASEGTSGPEEVVTALKKAATSDSSARVRAYALRGLTLRGGFDEETLEKALSDPDPSVSATAVQMTEALGDESSCRLAGVALKSVRASLEKNGDLVRDTFGHTVRAALEAAVDCPLDETLETDVKAIASTVKNGADEGEAGASRFQCLTRLILGADDLALVSCDKARPYVGKEMLIRRLTKRAAKKEQDLETLKEMLLETDPRVTTAAAKALGKTPNPNGIEALLTAIEDERAMVVVAALDFVAENPKKFLDKTKVDPNTKIIERIGSSVRRFAPFDNIEAPLISALFALKALGSPASDPILKRLAADTRSSIRNLVKEVYDSIEGIDPPEGLPKLEPVKPLDYVRISQWKGVNAIATVHTTRGPFVIKLLGDTAPVTVDNFASLASAGFYSETEIHRVVPNFVIQGGDPTGTGSGDPGYSIRCEANQIPYERGVVGMALAGKDTGGSQFFVTLSRQPHLNGKYTVFGRVISGMEVVDVIEEGDYIERVTIEVE